MMMAADAAAMRKSHSVHEKSPKQNMSELLTSPNAILVGARVANNGARMLRSHCSLPQL
jgi:hypothetical protein